MSLVVNSLCIAALFGFLGGGDAPLPFGEDAPEFRLYDQEGFIHTLVQHRGEFVLLFFYPKDFTHPTVKLASAFEKAHIELRKHNVVVYGVSPDFQNTHLMFHEKFQLSYDLLSDPDSQIMKEYKAMGLLGGQFISYLIGPDGRVFRSYKDESPLIHPDLVLNDLRLIHSESKY